VYSYVHTIVCLVTCTCNNNCLKRKSKNQNLYQTDISQPTYCVFVILILLFFFCVVSINLYSLSSKGSKLHNKYICSIYSLHIIILKWKLFIDLFCFCKFEIAYCWYNNNIPWWENLKQKLSYYVVHNIDIIICFWRDDACVHRVCIKKNVISSYLDHNTRK